MKTAEEVKIQMGIDRAKYIFEKELIPLLIRHYAEGHTEFRLAMQSDCSFIVHALGKDSETVDINWERFKGRFASEEGDLGGDLDMTGFEPSYPHP